MTKEPFWPWDEGYDDLPDDCADCGHGRGAHITDARRLAHCDCQGFEVRTRPPGVGSHRMTAHCATCSCGVGEDIPRPATSSEWARRQAREAAAAAIRAAREKRTAGKGEG